MDTSSTNAPQQGGLFSEGSALISALLVMALVAIAATAMTMRLQQTIYRTQLTITHDKLMLASDVVTLWAINALQDSKIKGNQETILSFPTQLSAINSGFTTSGSITDLQARFNLNNLGDQRLFRLFYHLLRNQVTLPENTLQSLARETAWWFFPPQQEPSGTVHALDSQPSPAQQRTMQDVSEFRTIKLVSASIYNTMRPLITALPEQTPININTAPKSLLKLLGSGLNEQQVNEILLARQNKLLVNDASLQQLLQKLAIPYQSITTESMYYLCTATTSNGDLHATVYTLLKRVKTADNRVVVGIIHQSLSAM